MTSSFFSSSPSTLSPTTSPNTSAVNIAQRFRQNDYIRKNLTEQLYEIKESHDDEEEEETGSEENERGLFSNFKYCIETHLVVYKTFYFMFYGAVGALFPYLAVFYKQLYLSAQQVGFLIGIRPFIQMATAPMWGALADTYNVKKIILLMSIAAWLGTNYSISFVRIPTSIACAVADNTTIRIPLPGKIMNSNDPLTNTTTPFNTNVPEATGAKRRKEKLHQKYKHFRFHPPQKRQSDTYVTSVQAADARSKVLNETTKISESQRMTAADEMEEEFDALNIDEAYPWALETTETSEEKESAKKNAVNVFIVLIIITIIGTMFASPTATLADTATLENLDDKTYQYGFQRVWGALGWGLGAFLVGFIVSYIQKLDCLRGNHVDYILSFYVYAAMMGLAFISAMFFKFSDVDSDSPYSQSLWEALILFCDCQHISFVITLLTSGASLGFIHTFLFWHLHDLGGTQMLFSVLTGVQCLSEVIMYFVSGYLLLKIGYDNVLYIGLLSNVGRLLAYSCISRPAFSIPVEILQGISSASIWTAAVCYIGLIPGAPVTLQALLHGVYWGLGHGGGGIVGGIMVTYIGSNTTFLIYAVLGIINLLYLLILKYRSKIMELLGNYTYVENIPAGTYILTSMSQRGTSESDERTR